MVNNIRRLARHINELNYFPEEAKRFGPSRRKEEGKEAGREAGQFIATQAKHVLLLKHANLNSVYFSRRAINFNAISKLFIVFVNDF